MSPHVTLFVPSLLQPVSERDNPEYPALPTLDRALSKARVDPVAVHGKDPSLLHLFGVADAPSPAPVAALGWLADGADNALPGTDSNANWLRADPVHLHTDRDRLLLFDARQLALRDDEVDALSTSLGGYFAECGMHLHTPHPQRWYLQLPQPPRLVTTPLEQVTGRDLLQYMPAGEDGGHWRRLLNEVQMLLFQHPVNEQREQRGQPTINSLWFWGNGDLPTMPTSRFARVLSNDPLCQGLARASSTPSAPLPDNAEQWLQSNPQDGAQLLQLDAIHDAHTLGSIEDWTEALQQFEQAWLVPLLAGLNNKRLAGILLVCGDGRQYRLDRSSMRRWWRRSKPWQQQLQNAPDPSP